VPAGAFPRTIGHQQAGEIVEVGEGVTSRKIDDRVGVPWFQASCGRCEWCLRGEPMFCAQMIGTSIGIQGSHAEYMVAYGKGKAFLQLKELEEAGIIDKNLSIGAKHSKLKGLLNSISIAGSDNPLVEVEYKGKQSNVILTTQGESTLKIFGE
jgi:threonine dehydrogenase-like Zn-dependent dehydrogenase